MVDVENIWLTEELKMTRDKFLLVAICFGDLEVVLGWVRGVLRIFWSGFEGLLGCLMLWAILGLVCAECGEYLAEGGAGDVLGQIACFYWL